MIRLEMLFALGRNPGKAARTKMFIEHKKSN